MSMRDDAPALLEVEGLTKTFTTSRGAVQAVSDVSFQLRQGETLGIVGETGSGKSTLVRSVLGMPRPTSGRVLLKGQDITTLHGSALRRARGDMQMIFQDAMASLDSRWTVERSVSEPLRLGSSQSAQQRRARAAELLDLVGLNPKIHAQRYPRQLSGGQAQRVAIARAIALAPSLVICDEPVSALDVSVQAQIINLLERIKTEFSLSYIFVSHDLSVVRHISDRVAVMYLGRFCEIGSTEEIYRSPKHPYTQALLDAVPGRARSEGREPLALKGDLPSPSNPPSGCRFHTRCPLAQERCTVEAPALRPLGGPDQTAACHFPLTSADALPALESRATA
jgi:oligopeptide/dipeptide ABC transporter ATP-binding protein